MKRQGGAAQNPSTEATGTAGTAVAFEPVAEPEVSAQLIEHEQIARLAYSYWEGRGSPYGSPEEDWFRAERDLEQHASEVKA